MKSSSAANAVTLFSMRNAVPIVFLLVSAIGIYYSQFTAEYLIQEMLTQTRQKLLPRALAAHSIMAGMGLNFGMELGAMAGQIGLIFISDWTSPACTHDPRRPHRHPRSPSSSAGCAAWCSTRPAAAKWSPRTFSASS